MKPRWFQKRGNKVQTKPIISTAKVRGLIKKNGINYVDATRSFHSSIATGIHVWQLSDSIYFQAFGFNQSEKIQANLSKFIAVIEAEGFAVRATGGIHNTHEIVAKVGA